LPVLTLSTGYLGEIAADAGLTVVAEAFADRGYQPDGSLVPRGRPGAMLTDPAQVAARAVRMMTEGVVRSADGSDVAVRARSLCIHGDTQGAVALATAVRAALEQAGVRLAAFA